MKRAILLLAILAAGGAASRLVAQIRPQTSVAFYSESYSFDPGLVFKRVNEYSMPVVVTVPFGRTGDFVLSSGYAFVQLRTADAAQLQDQSVSGLVDTEMRFSWNALPGRLVAFATATLPTGIKTVQEEQLSILGVLSSDIIGFAAPALGTGGNVGGGFGGAIPLSRSWSIGIGGTLRMPFSYVPVVGEVDALKPGFEARLRGGVEGRLGRRTYMRAATIWSYRAKDMIGDSTRNGIGNRIVTHVSLNQGIGNNSIALYAFDVFRGTPQLEATALGAAVLPRGNLIAVGVSGTIPIGRRLAVMPLVEFRLSSEAKSPSEPKLWLAGESLRLHAALRYQLNRQVALMGGLSGMTGFLVQSFEHIGLSGLRGDLHIEWRP